MFYFVDRFTYLLNPGFNTFGKTRSPVLNVSQPLAHVSGLHLTHPPHALLGGVAGAGGGVQREHHRVSW